MRTGCRNFNQTEDDFICSHYSSMPCRDIARHLNRPLVAIRKRAVKLCVTRPLKRWNEKEDQVIRDAKGRKLEDVARQLGRRDSEISARARKLGISGWRERNGFKRDHGRAVHGFTKNRNGKTVRVLEHRYVMAKHLGRDLSSSEIVHHIDCDFTNDRIGNLHLFNNRSEHRKAHHSLESILPMLLLCGSIKFNRSKGVYQLCANSK